MVEPVVITVKLFNHLRIQSNVSPLHNGMFNQLMYTYYMFILGQKWGLSAWVQMAGDTDLF